MLLAGLKLLREHQLAHEEWIAQIRQRVVKALRAVNGAELRQIGFMEFGDKHSERSTRFGVRELALAFTVLD